MAGSGSGVNAHIRGRNLEKTKVNDGGLHVQNAYPGYISFRLRTTSAEEGSQLPDLPCSLVVIRNASDPAATVENEPIFICGVGANANGMDSMFLRDDESEPFPIDNANKLLIHCEATQDVRVQVFLNSDIEVDLSQYPNVDQPVLDLVAPTVLSSSPADTATGVVRDTDIEKFMSEAIAPASVTTATFTISPAPPAPGTWIVFVDPTDPTKLVLNPDSTLAGTTLYTITLTTGIQDLSGNNLAAPHVTTFTTEAAAPPPDVGAPSIISRDPDISDTDVNIGISPTIIFDEDIDEATVNSSTVKLILVSTGSVEPNGVSLGDDKRTVTIDPTSSLAYATQYQIQVIGGASGVKDIAGNPMAATSTWQFTTAAQSYTLKYNVSYNGDIKLSSHTHDFGAHSNWGGEIVANGSSQLNQITPRKVIVQLRKVGSPTGNIKCQIRSDTTTVVKQIGTSLSAASVATSNTEYTFIESGNTTKLQPGYRLVINFDGGNDADYIVLRRNTSNAFDGVNSYDIIEDRFGEDTHNTGYDMGGKIYE